MSGLSRVAQRSITASRKRLGVSSCTRCFSTYDDEPQVKAAIKAVYLGRLIRLSGIESLSVFSGKGHRQKSIVCRRDFTLVTFKSDEELSAASADREANKVEVATNPCASPKARAAVDAFLESPTPVSFERKHLAIFKYGSVVSFGLDDGMLQHILLELRSITSDPVAKEFQLTEEYTIVKRPNLTESCVLRNDMTILGELDLHSAIVISTVMAQTVALDHYSTIVDEMLDIFTEFNRSVELTGKFVAIERYNLFKLVAQNNAVLIAVLSRLSLLERNDIAWKLPAYSGLWEGLREEFELDGRFENLKYKLNLIQDNTKFFLEIMHNQKSDMLEWTIIVLISFEIILSSMELCEIKPTWIIKALSSLAS